MIKVYNAGTSQNNELYVVKHNTKLANLHENCNKIYTQIYSATRANLAYWIYNPIFFC